MSDKKRSNIIELDDLRSFVKIFAKNWHIIFGLILISGVLSYFYTYKLPNIYSAKSQILLKSDETYDYQSQLYKGLGFYQAYQDNDNQRRVITSNDLIKKALLKLKLNVSYFIVGRLKTTEVYESMPFEVIVKHLNIQFYEQRMKFKIIDENQFQLTYMNGTKEVEKLLPFNKEIVDSDFVLEVKKNENINDKSILSLNKTDYQIQIHSIDNLVSSFKNNLTVESIENTTILELGIEDEIPSRAITFLDTLSKVYIDNTAESEFIINKNTLDNIDKQLAGVTEILNSIENDLENFKENKQVLNLKKQEDDYFEKLVGYDAKRREVQLWVQSLDALEKYILAIGESKEDKLLPPSFYIQEGDDYLRTAINELYAMQMSRNQKLYGTTDANYNIAELDKTTSLIKKNILTYITNSRIGLKAKIQDLSKQIDDYSEIIKKIPQTERGLLTIQRQVDVNVKMYEYLLEKRASTVIARSGILPQTSIIETAHSMGIIKPNKRKITYYFIGIALVLGLVISFIRTILFSTIENMAELKRLTNLPVLGEIILSPEAQDNYIIVDKDPKAAITESFRAIRTNLQYMASDATSKVILVTSYNPGEGKTFCSANIATIIAKAGKKVLLVELDLHKPKVQKALGMSSDVGVSTILIGKTGVAECVLSTEIENMSVILSGPTPPNASEIILSKHLKEIFDYGREHFDFVIVDTAPVGLITDALVIMKNVDISLFVLNTKYAKKQVVAIAQEIVETNKLKNFGFILNGVKRSRARYYYNYGYGYGYGNSYGYGYGNSYGYGNNKKKK